MKTTHPVIIGVDTHKAPHVDVAIDRQGTRECLVAIPDTSITGRRAARELTALIRRCGKSGMNVSNN